MIFKRIILCCILWVVTIQVFASSHSEENTIDQFIFGHISNQIMRFGHSENSQKILSENAATVVKNTLEKTSLDENDQRFVAKIIQIYEKKYIEILEDPIYTQQVKNIFKQYMSGPEIIALWTAPSPPHQDIYKKYANASLEVAKFSSTFIEKKLQDPIFLEKYQYEIQKILDTPEDQ